MSRYDQDRVDEFLKGMKKTQQDAIRSNLKADAGIILALAGWHAYKQIQIQRKGRK